MKGLSQVHGGINGPGDLIKAGNFIRAWSGSSGRHIDSKIQNCRKICKQLSKKLDGIYRMNMISMFCLSGLWPVSSKAGNQKKSCNQVSRDKMIRIKLRRLRRIDGKPHSKQYLETSSSMGTGYFPSKQARQSSSLGMWVAFTRLSILR
jgi:hypothetical protein